MKLREAAGAGAEGAAALLHWPRCSAPKAIAYVTKQLSVFKIPIAF